MGCGSSSASSADGNKPKTTTDEKPKTKTEEKPKAAAADDKPKTKTEEKPKAVADDKPAPKAEAGSGSTGNQFLDESVQSHNKYRAMHGVPAMSAAQELTDYAQNYANELAKRDTMEHSKCTLPSGGRVGENLYCYWSSDKTAVPTAEDAVKSWYDEIKDYNFSNHGFAMNTGHFTQVVWKGSTELGMAWAKAASGTTYVVANYRPAGNMMGDFDNNVPPKM